MLDSYEQRLRGNINSLVREFLLPLKLQQPVAACRIKTLRSQWYASSKAAGAFTSNQQALTSMTLCGPMRARTLTSYSDGQASHS